MVVYIENALKIKLEGCLIVLKIKERLPKEQPTVDGRPDPTVVGRLLLAELLEDNTYRPFVLFTLFNFHILRHIFQHGRCIPSNATDTTSLERIGTTIVMPSKGCEGLKKRRRS
ncbi:hypothetical protein M9H77_35696 [Catharanthus roseus]|uniref:Uncharacterized protein n=1 Tax=Catharanthus roseus TaxID=4058 RepID=A0ACB9ZSB3_CATRO|nr:hypothetical protein M9H77_35696 [Catharanthus roseus]